MTKDYRFICILDSVENGNETISNLDASPDCLHIHILKSDLMKSSIDSFASSLNSESINFNMYQWGTPLDKEAGVRSEKVSAEEIKAYSQVGIGSAARGAGEESGDFIGGGEGFLFNEENYRITKGNKALPVEDEEKYWTFQACDFNGAKVVNDLKEIEINGRNNLLNLLKDKSENKPFIAVFDADFSGDYLSRSNGIFPEDHKAVDNLNNVFSSNIQGGHLLGGSSNKGDLASLKSFDPTIIKEHDFSLKITSNVLLKEVHDLKIFKKNGETRKPRTSIAVNEAATLIQQSWQQFKR